MITFKAIDSQGTVINSSLIPFKFPAGEAHIKKEPSRELEDIEIAILQLESLHLHDDLFALAMWADFIDNTNDTARKITIIPYFPGARADRGTPLGLEIYADFINKYSDEIHVLDPHSDAFFDYFPEEKVHFIMPHELHLGEIIGSYSAVIAPDKGALTRASLMADKLGIPCITATKERDFETGKLSSFNIDLPPVSEETYRYLIVDDICDGGGTFLGLAKASGLKQSQLDLFISHGVFSGDALSNLSNTFGKIYTTNSIYSRPYSLPASFTVLDTVDRILGRVDY